MAYTVAVAVAAAVVVGAAGVLLEEGMAVPAAAEDSMENFAESIAAFGIGVEDRMQVVVVDEDVVVVVEDIAGVLDVVAM